MGRPFEVEVMGFTESDYMTLKTQGVPNHEIYDKLGVSRKAFYNWKKAKGLVDVFPNIRGLGMDNKKRIEINNQMVRDGCHYKEIAEVIKLKASSYYQWRYMQRKEGFEVL